MALTTFSLEAALQSLAEDGYIILEEAGVGGIVSEIEQRGFNFLSPYGLDYYKQHILDNTSVRSILEALFERCSLGHWLRYNEQPGHIECFGTGEFKAGSLLLAVHQWPKGSTVVCWSGSHRANINTKTGKRSTLETTEAALLNANCKAKERKFPEGALMIRDPRLCIESRKGYTITYMFATEELLSKWPKIILPDLPELRDKSDRNESKPVGHKLA